MHAGWPLAALVMTLGASGLALLAQPWWARRRHRRLRTQPFPPAWARILQRRVPLVQRLPAPLRGRLLGLIQVFIADKPFIGCAGLEVDDEMRVSIAAQACLLLLGQTDDTCYPRFRQVRCIPAPSSCRVVGAAGGSSMSNHRDWWGVLGAGPR